MRRSLASACNSDLPKVRTVNNTLLGLLALLHASGILYVAVIR